MLQSTLPFVAFQGVFRVPGANLLLSPIAFMARIYFHNTIAQSQSAFQTVTELALSVFITWGAKLCGVGEQFKAAARIIDIVSCGVELSDATDALAAQVSHIFTYTLYGTSLETAIQRPCSKQPSYDFHRLSHVLRRFFLALAQFHCALSGEGSELLLFRNISYLLRRFKVRPKCTQLILYLLPMERNAAKAAVELLERAYDRVHVTDMERVHQGAKKIASSAWKFVNWGTEEPKGEAKVEKEVGKEEEVPPLQHDICWTATR